MSQAINKRRISNQAAITPAMTVGEFFAGIGLMRFALEREGWQVLFANDIAPDKKEMYVACFPDSENHFSSEDIHELDPSVIPAVTLATASFPCTDLSLAGMRNGFRGKHSSAFWGFIRILEEMGNRRPPIVLLENVAGFLSSHEGKDFHSALTALNQLGYAVDAFIVDAERFLPQSRVRLFVVGTLESGKRSKWHVQETPSFYESDVRPKPLADYIFQHPEINWLIRDLPSLPQRTIQLKELLEDLPVDSSYWWNKERSEYLQQQMSERHANVLHKMIKQDEWSYGTIFRRVRNGASMAELRTDGVAGCLRTPRGGSGRQILVIAGFGQIKVRLLTPLECARLMGADDFPVHFPLNQALFGFGDAVCVPVVQWIARHYLNPLVTKNDSSSRMAVNG